MSIRSYVVVHYFSVCAQYGHVNARQVVWSNFGNFDVDDEAPRNPLNFIKCSR